MVTSTKSRRNGRGKKAKKSAARKQTPKATNLLALQQRPVNALARKETFQEDLADGIELSLPIGYLANRGPMSAIESALDPGGGSEDVDGEALSDPDNADAEDVDMESSEGKGEVISPPNRVWPRPDKGSRQKPSWWNTVARHTSEEASRWLGSWKLCLGCRDDGPRLHLLPSVRCVLCFDIYCADEEYRNTHCVSVPSLAKDWLCPGCIIKVDHDPTKFDLDLQRIRTSHMNRSYTMQAPELPGFLGASLNPVLVIQVSCNVEGHRPSLSAANCLWRHIEHVYGVFCPRFVSGSVPAGGNNTDIIPDNSMEADFVEIKVTAHLREPDPIRQKAKEQAVRFLSSHPTASVVISLDAHTYTDDGTIIFYGNYAAPIAIVLVHALGLNLWTAISRSKGPFKILLPMVCGWTWRTQESIDEAKDVMRPWKYTQAPPIDECTMIPALCNYVIGFSSTSFIPWTVVCGLASALGDILLLQTPVRSVVEHQLCQNHSLMRGTGVVFGRSVASGSPEYHVYTRSFPEMNLFGLCFPPHCNNCQAHTECAEEWSNDMGPLGRRIICTSCKWGTQWFLPPPKAIVKSDPFIFCWRLPLAEQRWDWCAPRNPGDSTPHPVTILSYV